MADRANSTYEKREMIASGGSKKSELLDERMDE